MLCTACFTAFTACARSPVKKLGEMLPLAPTAFFFSERCRTGRGPRTTPAKHYGMARPHPGRGTSSSMGP